MSGDVYGVVEAMVGVHQFFVTPEFAAKAEARGQCLGDAMREASELYVELPDDPEAAAARARRELAEYMVAMRKAEEAGE